MARTAVEPATRMLSSEANGVEGRYSAAVPFSKYGRDAALGELRWPILARCKCTPGVVVLVRLTGYINK